MVVSPRSSVSRESYAKPASIAEYMFDRGKALASKEVCGERTRGFTCFAVTPQTDPGSQPLPHKPPINDVSPDLASNQAPEHLATSRPHLCLCFHNISHLSVQPPENSSLINKKYSTSCYTVYKTIQRSANRAPKLPKASKRLSS